MAKPASKLTKVEVLKTAHTYFYAGFLFLPILWVLNLVYLYPEWKSRGADLDPKVYFYLKGSLIGASIFFIITTIWFIVYMVKWQEMGLAGELLMIVMPRGVS
jgi:presenilin enhancer 2